MSYRSYRRRDEEGHCRCCGRTTYRSTHDHFPECNDGCAEWVVDSKGEWRYMEIDRWEQGR